MPGKTDTGNEEGKDQGQHGQGTPSNALAIREPVNYAITTIDADELKSLIDDNLGTEALGPGDLERIVVPASGMTLWTLNMPTGEENVKDLEGIIVSNRTSRTYWEGDFSGSGTPPDCFSDDGENGIGAMGPGSLANPTGLCKTCPLAEFGSKESGSGRAKACKESKLFFVVLPEEVLPRVISVPPTSLKAARRYTLNSVSQRLPLHAVTTVFSLEKDKNADGTPFSKIKFTQGSILNDDDRARMKAYADQLAPMVKKVRVQTNDQQGGSASGPVIDMEGVREIQDGDPLDNIVIDESASEDIKATEATV